MKKYFTLEESLDYLNKNLLENKLSKEDLFYLIGKNELQPLFYYAGVVFWIGGEFKHEVRQFQKPYDNQQAEQISLMV